MIPFGVDSVGTSNRFEIEMAHKFSMSVVFDTDSLRCVYKMAKRSG